MKSRIANVLASMALVASAVAQSITASNSSVNNPPYALYTGTRASDSIAELNPLTTVAKNLSESIAGYFFLANPDTASNITANNIALISCDQDAYPGNLQANSVITTAINKNVSAIVLYSTESETCNLSGGDSSLNSTYIYSVTDRNSSASIYQQMQKISSMPGSRFSVMIFTQKRNGQSTPSDANNDSNSSNGNNPLGPSPSTAVAMIILYSITGVITALFLIIIITGAIRAHRHPDRYGPRDGLGRPRQSRAKGLARAMLDSIPIVKFGENEPPKPADVELAEHHDEHREVNEDGTPTTTAGNNAPGNTMNATATQARNLPEGIAPAENTGTTRTENETLPALGCSICTDDFERGQDIRVLPCDHKFHPECVDPWLLNISGTCPLCRIDLRPKTARPSQDGQPGEGEGTTSDAIAPPLEDPENSVDQENSGNSNNREGNRRSRLVSLFAPERLRYATPEERLSAARRLRERTIRPSGNAASSEPTIVEEGAAPEASASPEGSTVPEGSGDDLRRRRRLTMRLQDVFGIRTRRQGEREASPPPAESRSS